MQNVRPKFGISVKSFFTSAFFRVFYSRFSSYIVLFYNYIFIAMVYFSRLVGIN